MRKSGACVLAAVVMGARLARVAVLDDRRTEWFGDRCARRVRSRPMAGEVRALRVKATDTVNKISYTVFTNSGRYQIRNLPASKYTVQIVEEEFEAPTQTVDVPAGAPQTANLALKHKQVIIQGAGAAGAAAQSNYGAVRVNPDGQTRGARGLRSSCIHRARLATSW